MTLEIFISFTAGIIITSLAISIYYLVNSKGTATGFVNTKVKNEIEKAANCVTSQAGIMETLNSIGMDKMGNSYGQPKFQVLPNSPQWHGKHFPRLEDMF